MAVVGAQHRAQGAHAERAVGAEQLQGPLPVLGAPAAPLPQRPQLGRRLPGRAQAVPAEGGRPAGLPEVRPDVGPAVGGQAASCDVGKYLDPFYRWGMESERLRS